jgi:hypothetical protein
MNPSDPTKSATVAPGSRNSKGIIWLPSLCYLSAFSVFLISRREAFAYYTIFIIIVSRSRRIHNIIGNI